MSVDPTMYIVLNKGLGMSTGKIASQAAHAAVEAYIATPPDSNLLRLWRMGLHYKKIVLQARNTDHMYNAFTYIYERGFNVIKIIDEGHTEVPPHSLTALGVALVDKNEPHARATFSSFELHRDEPVKSWWQV
jgi:PTH2 family peptidyl-tRNA hydrolase